MLPNQYISISIGTNNSELGELVASITLANPFLFFLEAASQGGQLLIMKQKDGYTEPSFFCQNLKN